MQQEVVAFLSTPAAYGPGSAVPERIDTHISTVWLVRDRAYKLKREVRFDYVDYSTSALRRVACEAEVRLNRRTAPDLYLGVRAVTRESNGALAIGGTGEAIDWLVEMKRFDQDALFDRLAERGRLDVALMRPLAAAVAGLHASARPRLDRGGHAGMSWVADGNVLELENNRGIVDAAVCVRLGAKTHAALARHASRLDERARDGLVRECHGDLHLRNICLIDGRPVLFDGVEFNDDISCVDVLYDIAFLFMDLWRRGLHGHANALFNEYVGITGGIDALCLMPLFLSCRAAVRAKTSLAAAKVQADAGLRGGLERAAVEYLMLAEAFLEPPGPQLIAIGGFSGSGKSTLALGLAPGLGAAPGALIARSDLIRKAVMGVPALGRLGPAGYAPAVTRRVYGEMTGRASAALRAGQSVVADAVFASPDDRAAIADTARAAGVPFVGLWIDGPPEILARRIGNRVGDASDATPTVLEAQQRIGPGDLDWHRIDGAADVARVLQQARLAISSPKAAMAP